MYILCIFCLKIAKNVLHVWGAFHLTGIAGFAGVASVADCWNLRRRRAIVAMQYTVAD